MRACGTQEFVTALQCSAGAKLFQMAIGRSRNAVTITRQHLQKPCRWLSSNAANVAPRPYLMADSYLAERSYAQLPSLLYRVTSAVLHIQVAAFVLHKMKHHFIFSSRQHPFAQASSEMEHGPLIDAAQMDVTLLIRR